MCVNQKELHEILQNDVKFSNNTLHEANKNELSLLVQEITFYLSKAPEKKTEVHPECKSCRRRRESHTENDSNGGH